MVGKYPPPSSSPESSSLLLESSSSSSPHEANRPKTRISTAKYAGDAYRTTITSDAVLTVDGEMSAAWEIGGVTVNGAPFVAMSEFEWERARGSMALRRYSPLRW